MFERVCIMGVGLIGGSIAAAIKARKLATQVVGYSPFDGEEAFRLGLLDSLASDPIAAVEHAELVIVATPPSQVAPMIAQVLERLSPTTLVTDVSSVKSPVLQAVKTVMGPRFHQFVSSHPIAGAESSGPSAARAELFVRAQVVINPNHEPSDLQVADFWRALGAQVRTMSVEEHDAIYAAVSHLPHAVAFSLCLALSRHPGSQQLGGHAAGGLRDTSRVGASSASLWTNILVDNAQALTPLLRDQAKAFAQIADAIADQDREALRSLLDTASAWRRAF